MWFFKLTFTLIFLYTCYVDCRNQLSGNPRYIECIK